TALRAMSGQGMELRSDTLSQPLGRSPKVKRRRPGDIRAEPGTSAADRDVERGAGACFHPLNAAGDDTRPAFLRALLLHPRPYRCARGVGGAVKRTFCGGSSGNSLRKKTSLSVQFTKAPALAIAGPSGSGKTESACRIARGYCGAGKKFLVIDTEEKRALYKKARYQPWDWIDFQPPFSPERYVDVLEAGKGYAAVVLDSGSHEFAGEGGLQYIHDETLKRLIKGDESKIEKMSPIAWSDAKQL